MTGGNEGGDEINQLYGPTGLYIDDDQTIYVADYSNHRIVEWKRGGNEWPSGCRWKGRIGNGAHQLSYPWDVIVDKERDSLIIMR